MKKQLEQFAAEHTLSLNKSDMYGSYNGYQVSIRWGNIWTSSAFYVGFHVNLGNKANEVINWLTISQKKELRIANVTVDGSGFYCIFTNMTLGSSLKKAHTVLYAVTEYLKAQGIPGDVCPYCGLPMEEKKLVEDNFCLFNAHEACFASKLSQVQDAETAEASMPNNYLKGFFGRIARRPCGDAHLLGAVPTRIPRVHIVAGRGVGRLAVVYKIRRQKQQNENRHHCGRCFRSDGGGFLPLLSAGGARCYDRSRCLREHNRNAVLPFGDESRDKSRILGRFCNVNRFHNRRNRGCGYVDGSPAKKGVLGEEK